MAAAFLLYVAIALQSAPPAGASLRDQPGSRPVVPGTSGKATSRPTSQPDDPLIASLIADLGSADFKKRNAAQTRLSRLGPSALPSLIRHINDPSPEIAERVQAIVQPPVDPDLRVDMAVELLATRRPENMERAVYMMFDVPELCCEPFLSRVPAMRGPDRVVGDAIAEQFRTWRGHYEIYRRNYERTLKRSEEAAARIKKIQTDGNVVHAEAAFQLGLEALESSDGGAGGSGVTLPSTQPAGKAATPTSQRS